MYAIYWVLQFGSSFVCSKELRHLQQTQSTEPLYPLEWAQLKN